MDRGPSQDAPIRVIIAEDHRLVREGLRRLMVSMPGIEVVGEAADGHELVEQALELDADVGLVDIGMRGLNGLEAIRRLRDRGHPLRCLVLAMRQDEESLVQALRVGARGFLLKDSGTAELELALRAIAKGDMFVSPAASRRVIEDYLSRVEPVDAGLETLTGRHREILQLIAEGYNSKRIAGRLGLSVKTVESHRAEMMRRLDIHDVAGLVRYAIRVGLVMPDSGR